MNIASLIPSIIGMGTTIGTAIPGLKKPKKSDASVSQVRAAQTAVAGAAVGGSQAGHGASRGLNIRAGLRSAGNLVSKAAGQGAAAANMDEQRYNTQMDARNERVANFGKAIGQGASEMAVSMIDDKKGEPDTSAKGLENNADGQGAAQGEATMQGAEQEAPASFDDPEVMALREEFVKVKANEELAASDDPRLSGPHAQFNTKNRLEELRTKSPTMLAPEIEEALDHRLRAKQLMLQDAQRYGIHFDTINPMINRQLGLKPGQGVNNPYGVRFDLGEGEE